MGTNGVGTSETGTLMARKCSLFYCFHPDCQGESFSTSLTPDNLLLRETEKDRERDPEQASGSEP